MCQRTANNGIIIGEINAPRLKPVIARMRSRSSQQFGSDWHYPEFKLAPPAKHIYALEVNGVWLWVNGCGHCNKNGEKMSYAVCEEHDRCQGCNIKREDAMKIPDSSNGVWGSCDSSGVWGFKCHTCHEAERSAIRSAAEARIPDIEDFDEWDFEMEDEAKCPWCSAKLCTDESYDADDETHECDECGNEFTLTAVHSVSWTTKRAGE